MRRAISSIRFRLTIWYVVILGVILFGAGFAIFAFETRSRLLEIDTTLRRNALEFLAAYDSNAARFNLNQVRIEGRPLQLTDGDLFLMVALDGQVLQQHTGLSQDDVKAIVSLSLSLNTRGIEASANYPVAGDFPLQKPDGRGYRLYIVSILDRNEKVGILVLGHHPDDTAQLAILPLEFLVVLPATLILAALGGYWLAGRAMRPVREITRTARAIEESDLSRRLGLKGHDEIAELAATFDDMLARLESAFQRQRQFTSDASHELRTPLTIVQLEINRALARQRSIEEYERVLSVILAENHHMTRLVNDLLILARADARRAAIKQERVDLGDLALEAVERLTGLAQANHIDLTVGPLPDLQVCGDHTYLLQMLINVVENAIKYTARVGNNVCVEVGSREKTGQSWGWLRVTDNGRGIEAEHLPRVFERFYRVDQARQRIESSTDEIEEQGGSGLGLAIVQWVVEAHSGTVGVTSTPGRGTVVEIELPLIRV